LSACKNCGTALTDVYCPHCGQKDVDLGRPIVDLAGELIRETFEVDGRMFRTLRLLFARPGALTSEYLAGHRRRYTPPLRLYLVISVLFFVAMAWAASHGALLEDGETLDADAPGQAQLIGDELPKLMFFLLPVFALLIKAAFRDRLYFDHLIYALHFHSAAYVALAVLIPLDGVADRHWLPLVVQLLAFAYLIGYFVKSLRRVYGAESGKASSVAVGVLFAYIIIMTLGIQLGRGLGVLAGGA
jgi:hypothetical protein